MTYFAVQISDGTQVAGGSTPVTDSAAADLPSMGSLDLAFVPTGLPAVAATPAGILAAKNQIWRIRRGKCPSGLATKLSEGAGIRSMNGRPHRCHHRVGLVVMKAEFRGWPRVRR